MILVTRPQNDSELTAKKLAELGFESLIEPMLIINQLNPKIPQADYYLSTSNNSRGYVPADKLISIPKHGKNAEALLHYTLTNLHGKKIVYLRGNEITIDLTERLKANGFDASSVVVYTSAAPTRLSDNFASNIDDVRTALFMSQKTVENFCRLATCYSLDLTAITAICLSKKIATSIDVKFKTIKTSKEPSLESMLDIIKAKE
jgi:uroporphyrinogen-III synthase